MEESITSSLSPTASLTLSLPIPLSESSSLASVNNSVSGSETNTQKTLSGKQRRLANLVPFKKGDGRPRGHRPKGAVSIRNAVDNRLNKRNANKIADTLIYGAENGEDKKTEMLLKLKGELSDAPVVNIAQNTLTVSSELIEAARQFLLQKQNNQSALPIIDAKEVKQLPQ